MLCVHMGTEAALLTHGRMPLGSKKVRHRQHLGCSTGNPPKTEK